MCGLEVAREIARAASAPLPDRVEDAVPAIRDALTETGQGRVFAVVVDALDEASTPREARRIAREVVRPLAEDCAGVGARVLVGTRRRDDDGDLIAALGAHRREIDLDTERYFAQADLETYALATLQLRGDPRHDSPYNDRAVAEPVATRIAEVASPNFLVAGLLARQHGLYDTAAVDPAGLNLPGGDDGDQVAAALGRYLEPMGGIGGLSAAEVLLP